MSFPLEDAGDYSWRPVMSGTLRPLEADPGGQPDTDKEVTFWYAFINV